MKCVGRAEDKVVSDLVNALFAGYFIDDEHSILINRNIMMNPSGCSFIVILILKVFQHFKYKIFNLDFKTPFILVYATSRVS